MDLSVLPHFTVDTVQHAPGDGDRTITGRISPLHGVRNAGGWLYRRPGPSIAGWLSHVPATPREVVEFHTFDLALAPELRAGVSYPWIDEYWQAYHVDMILAGQWEERVFVSTPARYFRLNGVIGWQPDGTPLPEDAEDLGVRDGGWDHEHCALCGAHIGAAGEPHGFVDPGEHWLCDACYHTYALPRDLGFLTEA